jgi:hypothetical protein
MTDEIPDGPGIATLVVAMPGSVRPATDTVAAMLRWLRAHGAPRTAEVLDRLQRHAWTIELPDPDAATQSELWATARFPDLERARAAARPYYGRVGDLMRWAPVDSPATATLLHLAEDPRHDGRTRRG